MKKKKKEDPKEKTSKDKVICMHYAKGNCRHGFLGKKPVNGVSKCPYYHPKACSNFMENGRSKGGCKGKCSEYHPRMCPQSMNKGECDKINSGHRCEEGYHRKGTKNVTNKKDRPKERSEQSGSKDNKEKSNITEADSDKLRSVFGEILKAEVVKIEERLQETLDMRLIKIMGKKEVKTSQKVDVSKVLELLSG